MYACRYQLKLILTQGFRTEDEGTDTHDIEGQFHAVHVADATAVDPYQVEGVAACADELNNNAVQTRLSVALPRENAQRLSIGQQQRLCLARSLAVEPDFILADEATSALDPVSSKTVEDLFVKLKEKYSIIMVTHTLRQALRIADHAVFLYLGEVIETGDAKKVFGSPEEELTRKYLSGVFS